MTIECKVVYSDASNSFLACTVGGIFMAATSTVGDKQAAEALGRKLLGSDFDQAELCGRADQGVFFRLTLKSDREDCDG